jgi:hypothetical protein
MRDRNFFSLVVIMASVSKMILPYTWNSFKNGGKEDSNHTLGTPLKMFFFKDSMASRSKNSFQNSPGYNKKAT